MTRKLYWEDSYTREFQAKAISIESNLVELNQTAFYPTGGGEPNDTGKLIQNGNEFFVSNVFKKEDKILHKVDKEGLKIGELKGIINWERRYLLMRMHTAAHLLATLIHNETDALITGGNLDTEKSRLDFNLETFDKEMISRLIQDANKLIKQGAEVKSYIMKREDAMKIPGVIKLAEALPPAISELRIVEIVGIDRQADGGNHVKNLNEIGSIEVVKMENKGKDNRRLYFTVGP
ncbi:MAG: alanyl-tRNA editing protein [Candidatus Aenigmarchaeota archaeon]|nr:alanyl-tRNA editing protein [Candidatus Aenigmarchaeota archaeon]